jgi:hypothetical protein
VESSLGVTPGIRRWCGSVVYGLIILQSGIAQAQLLFQLIALASTPTVRPNRCPSISPTAPRH